MLSLFLLASLFSLGQSTPLAPRQTTTTNRWETLPDTPALPTPINTATFSHEGTSLWYQKYNTAATGTPIVMIHGGLGYSAYFGSVIDILSQTHQVIAVDRRGHGRSTYNADDVFTFDMFASDTYSLLQSEGVTSAVFVGWSDGAATTLAALMNSTIDAMITKAFVFAGFQSVSDSNTTFTDTAIYSTFVSRCATEYATLQPSANFTDFATKVATLEGTLPDWSDAELAKIDGSKVMIAGADHDEAVNLAVPAHLNSVITGSQLVMLSDVSHFAPVQDPVGFAAAVEAFL
ncbi:related to alpha/beta fold family hydrolase [Phialocephala subalpina]|uniref:Related to alpha/beta fold family hydrolase n=1 Tax=Phialocephala subalpina TaxID=576137 RepID=A0A1L7WTW6_9HELO|nr:related to alpha/beta fold family hydrolase [Phialocephala subalpina]